MSPNLQGATLITESVIVKLNQEIEVKRYYPFFIKTLSSRLSLTIKTVNNYIILRLLNKPV